MPTPGQPATADRCASSAEGWPARCRQPTRPPPGGWESGGAADLVRDRL